MTSATKTNKRSRGGFTLLEMVMVLALAAVLMGGALGIMLSSSDEKTLNHATGEIELLAKQARTISILHQTPYALEFREGVVRLLPFAQAGGDGKRAIEATDPAGGSENRVYHFDPGVTVSVRRWNTDRWLAAAKDDVHVWRFDPDGLCEPISIHVGYGNSWMEDTFHPLTASAILEEKSSEIR
jgi:prepilin-type N-terminal cleavage/methylation domain-containing protein